MYFLSPALYFLFLICFEFTQLYFNTQILCYKATLEEWITSVRKERVVPIQAS